VINEQAKMKRRQSQQLCYKDLEHFITICNQRKIRDNWKNIVAMLQSESYYIPTMEHLVQPPVAQYQINNG
jgi:hypothetical protein